MNNVNDIIKIQMNICFVTITYINTHRKQKEIIYGSSIKGALQLKIFE